MSLIYQPPICKEIVYNSNAIDGCSQESKGRITILGCEDEIKKINDAFCKVVESKVGSKLVEQLFNQNKTIEIFSGSESFAKKHNDQNYSMNLNLDKIYFVYKKYVDQDQESFCQESTLDMVLTHELAHCLDENETIHGSLPHLLYTNMKEVHAIAIENEYLKEMCEKEKKEIIFRVYHSGLKEFEKNQLSALCRIGALKDVKEILKKISYEALVDSGALLTALFYFNWDIAFLLIEKEFELGKKVGKKRDRLDEEIKFALEKAISEGRNYVIIKLLTLIDAMKWDINLIKTTLTFAKYLIDNQFKNELTFLVGETFAKYKKGAFKEPVSTKYSLNILDHVKEEAIKNAGQYDCSSIYQIVEKFYPKLIEKKLVFNLANELIELIEKYSNGEYSPENLIKYLNLINILNYESSFEAKKIFAELQAPIDIEKAKKRIYLHNPLLIKASSAIEEAERVLAEMK